MARLIPKRWWAWFLGGATLLGVVFVWMWIIAPVLLQLPTSFAFTADIVSQDSFYNAEAGRFEEPLFSQTFYEYAAISTADGVSIVRNVFDVRTPQGDPIFSVRRLLGIDRKTLEHVPGYGDRDRVGMLFAPSGLTAGESFTYWHVNYDAPAHMTYVATEQLYGLEVLHYETFYEGERIDQTAQLGYLPGVGVTRGVELDPHLELWVEPVTGRLVKYQDETTAYYYDLSTGQRLEPWNTFSNTFQKRSVQQLAQEATIAKTLHLTLAHYVPTVLVLLAVWCLFVGLGLIAFLKRSLSTKAWYQLGGFALILLGVTVLCAWALDRSQLIYVIPGASGMNPFTAIGFLLVGMLVVTHICRWQWIRHVILGALLILALGLLAQQGGFLPVQLDLLLWPDRVLSGAPARVSQYTAVMFLLLTLIPFIARVRSLERLRLVEVTSIITSVISSMALLGYLFEAIRLLEIPFFFSASMQTAAAALLASGLLFGLYRPKRQERLSGGTWFTLSLILLGSLSLTIVLATVVSNSITQEAESEFSRTVSRTVRAIEDRVDIYVAALEGARGLLAASETVERDEWREYVDALNIDERYPGIQGVGYAIFVTPEQRAEHEQRIQEEGFPEYRIRPPGERDIYTAIIYLEPFDVRNQQAFGFDMYQEQTRRAAMDLARDTGQAALSGRITLVQEIDSDVQPGFLIYVPYYGSVSLETPEERQAAIVGYSYSPFRARNFFEGIIGQDGLDEIGLRIWDGALEVEEAKLYDDTARHEILGDIPRFEESATVYVAGRPWTMHFTSTPTYGQTLISRFIILAVLLAGMVASALLTVTYYTLVSSRRRAVRYAKTLTRDLRTEKAKAEAILSSLGNGLIVTDEKGVIVLVNGAFVRLLGWKMGEVVGRPLTEVLEMTDDQGQQVSPSQRLITQALRDKRVIATALQTRKYRTKSGSLLPVSITVSPIRMSGKVIGAVEVFRDVSKEVAVDKAKTEFVSLASHQLRTPLTSINWYAEMLLDGDAGALNEKQLTYMREIYTGNRRMVDLVNALLNVSRIELGTFMVEPEETNLPELIRDVVKELEPQIRVKSLRVTQEVEKGFPTVMLDQKLIRIVVQNLLSNAAKYTPEKGSVTVSLRRDGDSIKLDVADTGMGIPKDQQDKIFTKLFRADNVRTVDADGTGLGLYIIKSIIESSGGTVSFVSEEGKGTTFHVHLPASGMKARKGSKPLEPAQMPSPDA